MSDDKEAAAIAKIISALSGLDGEATGRVLRWACERFEVSSIHQKKADGLGKKEAQGNGISGEFEDIAGLFDAAAPKTEAARVLVVSYWYQAIQGHKDLS